MVFENSPFLWNLGDGLIWIANKEKKIARFLYLILMRIYVCVSELINLMQSYSFYSELRRKISEWFSLSTIFAFRDLICYVPSLHSFSHTRKNVLSNIQLNWIRKQNKHRRSLNAKTKKVRKSHLAKIRRNRSYSSNIRFCLQKEYAWMRLKVEFSLCW